MNKKELLKLVGSVEQVGGVRDYTFNDGKAKGVRAIEVNTGSLCFTILPDRCMDIAQCFYKGSAISWISKTGITAPAFYEKDEKNFLRSFYGGLVTTCGLKNIGVPYKEYGLHDRIANVPAEKISVFADWVGDDYVMSVSGQVRDSIVFGTNLVLKRTITTKLFSNEIILEDTVVNDGFNDEDMALCYHCNFGYPLLREGAQIINVPDEVSHIPAPIHNKVEECIEVELEGEMPTVGIRNDDITLYLTYKSDTLPDFLIWKMPGESEYVVGLEPRTTNYGGESIGENNKYVSLKPFEEYKTYMKFEIKEN